MLILFYPFNGIQSASVRAPVVTSCHHGYQQLSSFLRTATTLKTVFHTEQKKQLKKKHKHTNTTATKNKITRYNTLSICPFLCYKSSIVSKNLKTESF